MRPNVPHRRRRSARLRQRGAHTRAMRFRWPTGTPFASVTLCANRDAVGLTVRIRVRVRVRVRVKVLHVLAG